MSQIISPMNFPPTINPIINQEKNQEKQRQEKIIELLRQANHLDSNILFSETKQIKLEESTNNSISSSKKSKKRRKTGKGKNKGPYVTRRIRIYPTSDQIKYFCKCFGVSRFVYNCGVKYINDQVDDYRNKLIENTYNGCIYLNNEVQCCNDICEGSKYFCENHKNTKNKMNGYIFNASHIDIRKDTLINDVNLTEEEQWQKEVPYDTRQLILKDLVEAFEAGKTNKRNGNIKNFRMNYKSKKGTTQIFHINKKAIKINSITKAGKNNSKNKEIRFEIFSRRKIGGLRVRSRMGRWLFRHIKSIEADSKIIKCKGNQYYLLLSISKKKENISKKPFDVVAFDPGVRSFQTIYSPNGITGKIGDNFADNKLLPIAKRIDMLDSIASERTYKTRRRIRKRQALLRNKIKNVVNNLHWEAINFACNNFNTIITTHFETKNMVTKEGRKINNKTVRMMLGLSHYAFKQKLLGRAKENGNTVIVTNESHTSKTCGNCGNQNNKLNGSREFKCEKCGIIIDRDINGARNIFLRLIS